MESRRPGEKLYRLRCSLFGDGRWFRAAVATMTVVTCGMVWLLTLGAVSNGRPLPASSSRSRERFLRLLLLNGHMAILGYAAVQMVRDWRRMRRWFNRDGREIF